MDYTEQSCPVCNKQFEKTDDIVVCPVCGAPHHRECYELKMHCHYMERHKDGFKYSDSESNRESGDSNADLQTCKYCGEKLAKSSRFCNKCGLPVPPEAHRQDDDNHSSSGRGTSQDSYGGGWGSGNDNRRQQQYGQGGSGFNFDPMGGVTPDKEIGSGVTAGEAAKFVKTNPAFFTMMFSRIHDFNRSRFSFVGFLFTGGWLLYRKMYKLGAIFTAVLAIILLGQAYIELFYADFLNTAYSDLSGIIYSGGAMSSGGLSVIGDFFSAMSPDRVFVFFFYSLSTYAQFALCIVCGICGNRWYYKHCIKKIKNIKSAATLSEDADTALQTKGGVNTALAISLFVSYLLIKFIPIFL